MSARTAPGEAPATVRGEQLRVEYRGKTVLDVDRVEVPSGKTYALVGASGAGKSTLLRVLGLLEAPTSGSVTYDGAPVAQNDLAARRRIAAVFQKPYLLRGTVGANVAYGLGLRHVAKSERAALVADALRVVGLAGREPQSALTLSGGEAQRVALARALVLRPSFLLLDEPLSYMDPLLKRDLTLEFRDILASEKLSAFYVTHDQDEAAVVADVIGVMRDGRIIAEGEPNDVLTLPADPWVAAFLGTELPTEGTVTATDGALVTVDCGGAFVRALSSLPVGARVRVGVRPEDVVLFESGFQAPHGADATWLEGRVAKLAPSGASERVVVEAGSLLLSSVVSRSTAEALELCEGMAVNLLFKAASVRLQQI